jgi:hypothetical protein
LFFTCRYVSIFIAVNCFQVLDKLNALADLQKNEEDLSAVSFATPFMLFAVSRSFDSTVTQIKSRFE